MKVEDLMTASPERIEVTESIAEAFNRLFELDVRHLPVVDANGQLVGMLSDRDLRSFSQPLSQNYENAAATSDRNSAPVSDIMQGDVISVDQDEEITEVIRLMIDHKVGALPVIDPLQGNLVGIISYIDILREAEDLF